LHLHTFLQKSHLRLEKSTINCLQYKFVKFMEDFSINFFNNKNPRLNLFERHCITTQNMFYINNQTKKNNIEIFTPQKMFYVVVYLCFI